MCVCIYFYLDHLCNPEILLIFEMKSYLREKSFIYDQNM